MTRQSGFVLIFALWILAGCALLLAAYARSATQPPVAEALATYPLRQAALENAAEFVVHHLDKDSVTVDSRWQAQNEIARLEYAAAGGVNAAAAQLAEMLGQMGFKLDLPQGARATAMLTEQRQKLSSVRSGETGMQILEPLFSQSGGQSLKVGGHEYQVTVVSASARPNLNKLSAKALKRYLISLGLTEQTAETLSDSLRHWRGDTDVLTAMTFDSTYRAASPPYTARGKVIEDWSELALLAGSSPDLVAFLRQHFSLTGPDARVLMSQASPEHIAALADLDLDTVRAAITHLTGDRRDIALSDVIGANSAAKFEAAVVQSPPAEGPVRVEVTERQHLLTLTYAISARMLDELWLGR